MESLQKSIKLNQPIEFLFEDNKVLKKKLFFTNPLAEIKAETLEEIPEALRQIEHYQSQGFYVAGYLAYEAGFAFLPKAISAPLPTTPLVQFYVFGAPSVDVPEISSSPLLLTHFHLSEDFQTYQKKISQIHQYETKGDTYQVNYTLRFECQLQGHGRQLFEELKKYQTVEHAAFLQLPQSSIISLSPELFLKKQGDSLLTKPMKGTLSRVDDPHEDQHQKRKFLKDEKTVSENVMIVDLLRNDLSRVAKPTTVRVNKLFELETYETVHQMVSTIECRVDVQTPFSQIISKMFPCGSITGAPKLKTMEIISRLEQKPRGIYTGAIGYLTPDNDFSFNVAIRTLQLDSQNKITGGVGGGILLDSNAEEEFAECETKMRFLKKVNSHFYLFETMLCKERRVEHLTYHLNRLQKSARELSFYFDPQKIEQFVRDQVDSLDHGLHKIRLQLSMEGALSIKASPLTALATNLKIYVSDHRIHSSDLFFQHKTTQRSIYDAEFAQAQMQGFYDVIFLNEKGVVTEGSRHNILIEKNKKFYTSPVTAGLLPGVMRSLMITRLDVEEKELYLEDLQSATKILLTNAVRGLVAVNLVESP